MFKIVAIAIFACVLFIRNGETAPTALQILPEREGYIPVYIRNGDTPLVDINLELAEAFRETSNIQTREAKTEEGEPAADQTPPEAKPSEEKETGGKDGPPKTKRQATQDQASEAAKTASNEESAQKEEQGKQPVQPSSEEGKERRKRRPEEEAKPSAPEKLPSSNQSQEKLDNKSQESKFKTPAPVDQKEDNRPTTD